MPDPLVALQKALAGQYRVERELGHGAMAIVYLGHDPARDRRVAIKVLRRELAGILTRGRFLREIRISSGLAHPNILPLLDSGSTPDTAFLPSLPFYTTPFIEGESLRHRLQSIGRLPLQEALRVAGAVARALDYAHRRGVIHRDIKPANILLGGEAVLVADFGIARAFKESVDPDAVTSAGLVIGTPTYMSPEQATGRADVDGRSDLYSLACLLYESLVGEPPFTGATPQAVIARHRLDPAPSARTVRPEIPEALERTIRRALEKSPEDRFGTALEFAEALGS